MMVEQTNVHDSVTRFEDLPETVAALLTTPIVADSLDRAGARSQVMSPGIGPVSGSRIAGRARTVQFAPSEVDPEDPYGVAMDFIDTLAAGTVAVLATGEDQRTAYWGELFSASAMGHGAVGAVCDGPVRDLPKVRELGFGLFAPAARPIDFRGRMQVVATAVPVRCGGVLVTPGDLVFADEDGVVVVPSAREAEVLKLAVERASAEKTVLDELLGGASLRQVWERWHVL